LYLLKKNDKLAANSAFKNYTNLTLKSMIDKMVEEVGSSEYKGGLQ